MTAPILIKLGAQAGKSGVRAVAKRWGAATGKGDPPGSGSKADHSARTTVLVLGGLFGLPMVSVLGMVVLTFTVLSGGQPASGSPGGYGTGLRAGTVPAAYVADVVAAGGLCPDAPPSIIAAQLQTESGFNPAAVSSAGAQGIAQFMPGTWPSYSQPGQSPFDPDAAIAALGKMDCHLATQMRQAQDAGQLPSSLTVTQLMLAGYNAGPAAVLQARGIPNNGQTPAYVAKITALAASYSDGLGVTLTGGFAQRLVAAAQSQLGLPYAWDGGNTAGPTYGQCSAANGAPNDCHIQGFDCSGLVLYAVYQASNGTITLPHSADLQTRGGTPVARDAMQPGDLISFTDPGSSTAHHVGIYLGNNTMIDAPDSGDFVRTDSLTTPYYQGQQWRIARYTSS